MSNDPKPAEQPGSKVGSPWRLKLVDGPVLMDWAGNTVRRFRSQRGGALLAYLALRIDRPVPRERLYDALWPDEPYEVAANRFRVVLNSLRRQLEPAGQPFGSALDVSVPGMVRLRKEAVSVDIAQEASLPGFDPEDILPGLCDDWVLLERARWAAVSPVQPITAQGQAADNLHTVPHLTPSAVGLPPLPVYLTRFFGRTSERAQLLDLLSSRRVVTLMGAGGIGKTRLAVETARAYQGESIFVPMSHLSSGARLDTQLLQALGLAGTGTREPMVLAAEALRGYPNPLLVLDNAEQIAEPVAALCLRLMHEVPRLRILVTSRCALGLAGEQLVRLSPLPDLPESDDLSALLQHPAVALFVDRAASIRPDFSPTDRHLPALREICRTTECLPLALELAAARIVIQSPAQIAHTLSRTLLDLKSARRGVESRHSSLRATVESSLRLLSPRAVGVLAGLSVFVGGFYADAACRVGGCEETLPALEELVSASLLQVREEPGSHLVRFSFLEPVRQFSAELLTPQTQREAMLAHAQWFLQLASAVDENDLDTLLPLDGEFENLDAALQFGRREQHAEFWPALAGALLYAFVRGRHRDALRWIEEYVPHLAECTDYGTRMMVRYGAYLILPDVGRLYETAALGETMRVDAELRGDADGMALYRLISGFALDRAGQHTRALEQFRRAVHDLDEHPPWLQMLALCSLSGALHMWAASEVSDSNARRAALQEAEESARTLCRIVPLKNRRRPLAHQLLAAALYYQQRFEEAGEQLRLSEEASMRLGTTTELLWANLYAASIAVKCGDTAGAAYRLRAFRRLEAQMGFQFSRSLSRQPRWAAEVLSLEIEA
jgi:predicted ATPase